MEKQGGDAGRRRREETLGLVSVRLCFCVFEFHFLPDPPPVHLVLVSDQSDDTSSSSLSTEFTETRVMVSALHRVPGVGGLSALVVSEHIKVWSGLDINGKLKQN
ncbi:unnamed protein product [Pleuronectes platessa]|uniref:Uncharacterized protein n=1 Tax=Pleuronectes platessa TaxID=8262 RepID=A0A9N7UYN5_PLEPL|nr:unnamed protein product [Pleuronectes platessa]